jgi:hypothetical protein
MKLVGGITVESLRVRDNTLCHVSIQYLLEGSPIQEVTSQAVLPTSITVEAEPQLSSPTARRRRQLLAPRIIPDSEIENDDSNLRQQKVPQSSHETSQSLV